MDRLGPDTSKDLAQARFTYCAGWTHAHAPSYYRQHAHREFEIVYHLRGHGRQTVREPQGKRVVEFAEGSVVICPPGVEHDQTDAGEQVIEACVLFALPKPWPLPLRSFFYLSALPGACEREELLDLVSQTGDVSPHRRLANGYRVGALVTRLIDRVLSERANQAITLPPARYAAGARDYLHAHFMRLERMDDVAREVGISYHHLRHVFKATYGVSLVGYLAELRVNRAKELLTHSRLPIKTIADMCGFGDERYFATCFKERTRVTPGGYRRQAG
jgi:AraC-like DNA-binding protein